jgi:hypothetical protein
MRYTDDVLVADYYAQILATASTKESAKLVSVAFIEILNRLSADELKMLEFINSPANTLMLKKEDDTTYHLRLSGSLPVLNVHVKENSGGYYVAIKNLSYLLNEVKLDFPENYNLYIDNMIALGLMIKPAMIRTNDNNVYKFIKDLQSQQINKVQSELDPENSIDFSEARIEITDLGRQLILVGARKYVAT